MQAGRSNKYAPLRFRSMSSLAECETPAPEVKVERTTTTKTLKNRKLESENVASITQNITPHANP